MEKKEEVCNKVVKVEDSSFKKLVNFFFCLEILFLLFHICWSNPKDFEDWYLRLKNQKMRELYSPGGLQDIIRESFKFIRMTEDIQHMSNYLNDIRICFIAITVTIYIVLISWVIVFCVRRNRRNVNGGNVRRPRSQWDYQGENQNPGQTDDLVSVRSDGQVGMTGISTTPAPYTMSRNHRGPTPSFMRHGLQMNHAQQTTRLVADSNEGTVKHQISTTNNTSSSNPTTTTNPPPSSTNNNIGFTLQNLPSKHSEINGNGITGPNDTVTSATTTTTNNGRNFDRTITSGGGDGRSARHKEVISDM